MLNKDLYIGNMPPKARKIENAPSYLPDLLSWFSEPKSIEDAKVKVKSISELTLEKADRLINELIDKEVLIKDPYITNDRYSRHSLYYNMIDIDPSEVQSKLKNIKVALIGMGGIGSNVAMNLVGAGIGNFILIDDDKIELSNLTRQFLYNEEDVGNYKVNVAEKKLKNINSECNFTSVISKIHNQNDLEKNLIGCDIAILSADSPNKIHEWMDNAAHNLNIVYSNAGYIENYGLVGPLTIPGKTISYADYKNKGDIHKYTDNENELNNNLNYNYQAPSYGPLNSLVSSIQANEIIRYILGKEVQSKGTRLLIDSENYELYKERF